MLYDYFFAPYCSKTVKSEQLPDLIEPSIHLARCRLILTAGLSLAPLYDRNGGNWEVREYHGLVLKTSYMSRRSFARVKEGWHWPERNLAGNTIDFFTKVLEASFSYAMKEITNQP